jgi:hypothetical protein
VVHYICKPHQWGEEIQLDFLAQLKEVLTHPRIAGDVQGAMPKKCNKHVYDDATQRLRLVHQ